MTRTAFLQSLSLSKYDNHVRDQGLDLLSNPGFTGESGQAPVDLIRTLAVFAEAPSSEHIHLWQALGIEDSPSASEYADIFLFQLYPYASVHLGPEGMLGGEAQNRVAGFWRALGKNPPPEPDHLAALLGLYATLSEQVRPEQKVSNELSGFSEAEAVLITQGRDALLQEHIAPWVPAYLERVIEIASGPYRGWAVLLDKVLQVELVRVGHPERLPLHLRESPPLADPQTDGADAFISGLLAPVRAGIILTRADLARLASELDLGLRAGERRYALEHLLGQDSSGFLQSLAVEAARQALGHEHRQELLGVTADFFRDRAWATSELLRKLSDGGAKITAKIMS